MADTRGELIYDADCGFCTKSANWLARTGRVSIRSWQELPSLDDVGLTFEMVTTAAYWLDDGAPTASGQDAIARALKERGGIWRACGRLILFPPINAIARPVYRFIAKNRHAMPGGTAACKLPAA